MKSVFKLIFITILWTNNLHAREIILIENLATTEEGVLLQKILIKNFHLPKVLITLKNINKPCATKTDAIIHLCLLQSGDLQIKKMNQYVVQNSLGAFLNQKESTEGEK